MSATCWPWPGPGDVFCAGEVGAGILADSTPWAPGCRDEHRGEGCRRELSCCSQTTDRNRVTATGGWEGREEGPSPARSRAHIFQPLWQT